MPGRRQKKSRIKQEIPPKVNFANVVKNNFEEIMINEDEVQTFTMIPAQFFNCTMTQARKNRNFK